MILTLNAIIQLFSQDTLAYDDLSSDQVWLPRNKQFRKYSRKSYIFIIWALAVTLTLKIATTTKNFHMTLAHDAASPSLWPWHWTQGTNFSAWHSGLWCCITVPGLVTKYSVVQKISSGQTFINISNLCCDLDLERSSPIFQQDTLAYDVVLLNQVWLQTDQQFRRYSRHNLILIM